MFRFAKRGARPERAALLEGLAAALLATFGALPGCTEEVRLGRQLGGVDAGPGAAGAGGSGGQPMFPLGAAGSSEGGGGSPRLPVDAGPCVPVSCVGNTPSACGNCLDDDGDGWVDASDPECLGPCDDSELELFSGVETALTGSCRADCYFDRNSGSGDDGCSWSYRCDPGSVAPDYLPTGSAMCEYQPTLPTCSPSSSELAACRAGCLPRTPNGCDCFGCCELPAGSDNYIWLGSAQNGAAHCELATSGDREACRPCTPVPSCQNPCEECELCVGKSELPAQCSGAAGPACPDGVRSCEPRTGAGCSALEYCITGCCVPLPT